MSDILIVEDDPGVANMLTMTFAVEGYDTELIGDGRTAMDRLAGEPTRVVVLDVMMPHMSGFDVLQALRADERWDGTKVVVATALRDDEDVWRGWSSGADYYLVKPFDLDHLRDVVQRLLTGAPVV
ncbi:MAG: response regulator transcription factor [Actinomycetes bacterium]